MNSFVQSLFLTNEFTQRILNLKGTVLTSTTKEESNEEEKKNRLESIKSIPLQLQKLFALMMKSIRPFIRPLTFRATLPPFFRNNYEQHDSSEFAKIFLDELEKSLKLTDEKVLSVY